MFLVFSGFLIDYSYRRLKNEDMIYGVYYEVYGFFDDFKAKKFSNKFS